jgi:TPR repeat protein
MSMSRKILLLLALFACMAASPVTVHGELDTGLKKLKAQYDAEDFKKAEVKAQKGDRAAQFELGVRYRRGIGIGRSDDKAIYWFRKAAEQGNAGAQYYTGLLLCGRNEKPEGAKWYRKAAEQGNIDAQYILGVMYFNGEGVKQDYPEAAKWYRKAAEQGHPEAQNSLGNLYSANYPGIRQDRAEALKWYRKAAAKGHPGANLALKRPK